MEEYTAIFCRTFQEYFIENRGIISKNGEDWFVSEDWTNVDLLDVKLNFEGGPLDGISNYFGLDGKLVK